MKYLSFLTNNSFSAAGVIFTIIFFIVICLVMIEFMLAVTRWSYNNKQPTKTRFVIIKYKRKDFIHGTYYATFEFENGEIKEYQVNSRDYAMIDEYTRGLLDCKGSKFVKFRRI